ncbi:hypothetical protein CFC21_091345 [Triticum aestivum]|uniref:Uncharacterized protein n=2 Tax=Triticum aestivum TaxID=4565 RepID=A0A3B6QA56_WHEAT|nr:uncharacterized protein LOC123143387 isoform X2 [Triticum aestivum]KAF7088214.1 hypothetical protein CFC21_091345 [Triticum aestivum]
MAAAAREGEFSERELEVAAILADLPSIVRACNRRRRQQEKQQQARPEIPSWGRRRPRRAPAAPPAEKPAAAGDDERSEGVASPDTPLAFPEDDEHAEAAAAAAVEDAAKATAQDKWAQEQRGVVASLSHENAHLLKQIEDFRARLHTSRSTNDSLKQIHQSKHKKRHRPEEEEEGHRWKLPQARAADRPALDLNEPAEADAEDGRPPQTAALAAAQWVHRGHHQQNQQQQLMQMQHKAARRRRQEIRRAKAAAGRTRRQG